MTGDVPDDVTCEVCGTSFDPAESRGWCPDPECGEWQHPAFPLEEEPESGAGGGGSVSSVSKECPNCENEVRVDANFCKYCAHQFGDDEADTATESGGNDDDGDSDSIDECPDCGADLSSIPSERLADCPICGTDLAHVAAPSEPELTPADLDECPDCGTDLTSIPEEMRLVCPECRVDLEDAIETHFGADASTATEDEAATDTTTATETTTAADTNAPDADGADADVETVKGIGPSYAERLAEADVETVGELVGADAGALAERVDVSEDRVERWIENAPLDRDEGATTDADSSPPETVTETESATERASAEGGRTTDAGRPGPRDDAVRETGSEAGSSGGVSAHAGGSGTRDSESEFRTQIQRSPEELVLEVMNQEVHATDGDTIGRDIRTAMVESGASEEEAVYVHREHARLDLESGQFYLTRLGENSLKHNGRLVEKNERVPLETGDELSFSEVVTAVVRVE